MVCVVRVSRSASSHYNLFLLCALVLFFVYSDGILAWCVLVEGCLNSECGYTCSVIIYILALALACNITQLVKMYTFHTIYHWRELKHLNFTQLPRLEH